MNNMIHCVRYAIGDVMFFVANRGIAKGDELCFSYIEHELLCESAERRTDLLDMDFQEYEDDDEDRNDDGDDDDDDDDDEGDGSDIVCWIGKMSG
mmetsp:Transcript_11695/g.23772  ORF Transcript_11695/g.23772 Transcript_11695/m.23772 type:complete len:95 (-) Transcript_11695:533-817(-)